MTLPVDLDALEALAEQTGFESWWASESISAALLSYGAWVTEEERERCAEFIAACSPVTVAALVRVVRAALAQASAIEHLGDWREVEEEFHAALEPFWAAAREKQP